MRLIDARPFKRNAELRKNEASCAIAREDIARRNISVCAGGRSHEEPYSVGFFFQSGDGCTILNVHACKPLGTRKKYFLEYGLHDPSARTEAVRGQEGTNPDDWLSPRRIKIDAEGRGDIVPH